MTNEPIKSRSVSLGEPGLIEWRKDSEGSAAYNAISVEPGETVTIEGPDGFTLEYTAPEEEADSDD